MDDRINWFQGWVIILMIFVGISMLVHYENRGVEQLEIMDKQAIYERAIIRSDIHRLEVEQQKRQWELMAAIARSNAEGVASMITDSWTTSIVPVEGKHAIKAGQ